MKNYTNSGRYEHDKKLEANMMEYISGYPSYIKVYAESFTKKSATTQNAYVKTACQFLNFLKSSYDMNVTNVENLNALRPYHVESFINLKEDKSASYRAKTTYALKNFFKFLTKNRFIDSDPSADVEAPVDRSMHEVVALTKDEVEVIEQNILNSHKGRQGAWRHLSKWEGTTEEKDELTPKKQALVDRDMAIVMMGLMTGMRVSEIIAVNIEDIFWKDQKIRIIGKGGYERYAYFSDKLADCLHEYLKNREVLLKDEDTNALFLSTGGKRISYQSINLLLKNCTKGIDKHITPHKMRSSYATALYQKTGDIYMTATNLGHKNVQTTVKYAAPSEEQRKATAKLINNMI